MILLRLYLELNLLRLNEPWFILKCKKKHIFKNVFMLINQIIDTEINNYGYNIPLNLILCFSNLSFINNTNSLKLSDSFILFLRLSFFPIKNNVSLAPVNYCCKLALVLNIVIFSA